MTDFSTRARIAMQRQRLEWDQVEGAVADGLQMRSRRAGGPSVVYSIRLDRGELMALERRAIVTDAVKRVALAVDELRAVTGSLPMRSGFD